MGARLHANAGNTWAGPKVNNPVIRRERQGSRRGHRGHKTDIMSLAPPPFLLTTQEMSGPGEGVDNCAPPN
eukprot:scaffold11501_cov22-Prasinocladus_malaysianus.AAC.1